MNKKDVVQLVGFGNQCKTARFLGYKDQTQVHHWPEEFTDRQKRVVLMRLKAAGIKFPPEWLE